MSKGAKDSNHHEYVDSVGWFPQNVQEIEPSGDNGNDRKKPDDDILKITCFFSEEP